MIKRQKRQIIGVILFLLATIQIINFARLNLYVFPVFYLDFSFRHILSNINWPFKILNYFLIYIFGWAGLLTPILLFILGSTFFKNMTQNIRRRQILLIWGFAEIELFIYSVNYFFFIISAEKFQSGYIARIFTQYLQKIGGVTFIILFFLWSFTAYIIFLKKSSWKAFFKAVTGLLKLLVIALSRLIHIIINHKNLKKPVRKSEKLIENKSGKKESIIVNGNDQHRKPSAKNDKKKNVSLDVSNIINAEFEINRIKQFDTTTIDYQFPFNVLKFNIENEINNEEIHAYQIKIKDTFNSFDINLQQTGLLKGPRLLRFDYEMPRGILLKEIESYENEISHRLGGIKVDIQIPIPGTNTFGIYIPREKPDVLGLGSYLSNYQQQEGKIPVFIGVTSDGKDIWADASTFPHMLISGATGSGKSVFLNTLIISLLAVSKQIPINLILIDPKQVEFSPYKNISQLSVPIITDLNEAEAVLIECEKIMEERYTKISDQQVRNIDEYNQAIKDQKMPYIFVMIDEFGDLLLQDKTKQIKNSIIRLAQKSRAVGIHLILATQRPSSDIIDGLIKANFPTRIAFSTSSKVDSRIILDQNGAENLLGKGDMLFKPITGNMMRLQGLYVTLDEIKAICE